MRWDMRRGFLRKHDLIVCASVCGETYGEVEIEIEGSTLKIHWRLLGLDAVDEISFWEKAVRQGLMTDRGCGLKHCPG